MTIYGEKKKIKHGMTISAVVVGSKRKLWQWILDPLFSFYGDLLV
jgi:membrane fusion protein